MQKIQPQTDSQTRHPYMYSCYFECLGPVITKKWDSKITHSFVGTVAELWWIQTVQIQAIWQVGFLLLDHQMMPKMTNGTNMWIQTQQKPVNSAYMIAELEALNAFNSHPTPPTPNCTNHIKIFHLIWWVAVQDNCFRNDTTRSAVQREYYQCNL